MARKSSKASGQQTLPLVVQEDALPCVPPSHPLVASSLSFRERLDSLELGDRVTHVYNPLHYAWATWCAYLERYGKGTRRVLFMGINPGPWGMAQTGIPFGEVAAVRDWLGITGTVHKPAIEHPKKPVEGFACQRSEVSGKRLWGLFSETFGSADAFFRDHFVINYCPLLLTDGSKGLATNVLPEELPEPVRTPLFEACDAFLRDTVASLQPEWIVGVGKFAAERAQIALGKPSSIRFASILHPSPASPQANKDFKGKATSQLRESGVWNQEFGPPPTSTAFSRMQKP